MAKTERKSGVDIGDAEKVGQVFGSTMWRGCATVVSKLAVNASLVFFDPPFNIGEPYNGFDDKRKPAEHVRQIREMFAAVSENCARPDVLVAWHIPEAMLLCVLQAAEENGFVLWRQIVRAFEFGTFQPGKWVNAQENLLLFCRKRSSPKWIPENVLIPSARLLAGDKRTGKSRWKGKRPPGSVWNYSRIQGNHKERWAGHPNQLPIRYVMRLILAHSEVGDLVFDGCAGSGTMWLAAAAAGRVYLGCDISRATAESATRRRHDEEQIELSRVALAEFRAEARLIE